MGLRFAAFDLDGTVLDPDGRILDAAIAPGLRRLRAQGLTPIIVTGRSRPSFDLLRPPADFLALWDDTVLLDEADVRYHRGVGTLRHRALLPADAVPALLAHGVRDLVVQWQGRHYASSPRAVAAFSMAYRLPRTSIAARLPAAGYRPVRVTVFDAPATVTAALTGADIETAAIDPFAAVVLRPAGTDKATGLALHLAAAFGEPDLSRVIAFGDGDNDATLLGACHTGVATAHASPAAVAAARIRLDGALSDFLADFDSRDVPAGNGVPR